MKISINPEPRSNNALRLEVLATVATELSSDHVDPSYRAKLVKASNDLTHRVLSDGDMHAVLDLVYEERSSRELRRAPTPTKDAMDAVAGDVRPLLAGSLRAKPYAAVFEVPKGRNRRVQMNVELVSNAQAKELLAGFDRMSDAEQNSLIGQIESMDASETSQELARIVQGMGWVVATLTVTLMAVMDPDAGAAGVATVSALGALERGRAATRHTADLKAVTSELEAVMNRLLGRSPAGAQPTPSDGVGIQADGLVPT